MDDPVVSRASAWERARKANALAFTVTLIAGVINFAFEPFKYAVLTTLLVLVGALLVAHWAIGRTNKLVR